MAEKFLMSKSKFLCYKMCPFKFKLKYIDHIKEPRTKFSFYADSGTNVHKQIEEFYERDVKIKEEEFKVIKDNKSEIVVKPVVVINRDKYKRNKHIKNLIQFNENLIKGIIDSNKSLDYVYPISQEVDYYDNELKVHGLIDAVYRNYEDDGVIIMDWKSGKIKSLDHIRSEMAFYALCFNGDEQNKGEKAKYWGMYFTKFNYLFVEEISLKIMKEITEEVNDIQKLIEGNVFPKPAIKSMCHFCGFKGNDCK